MNMQIIRGRCVLVVALLVWATFGVLRAGSDDRQFDPVATFSILGFDPETGEMGGAVQSRVFSVG